MAITKIISDNEAAIKAAIKSNGQGEITGDLLQEKMLLLNRDLFGGQLDFRNASDRPLYVGAFNSLVLTGFPSGDMRTMLAEWYGDDAYPFGNNVYVPLWQAGLPGEKIVAYILLRKGTWLGEPSVEIYPILDTYGTGIHRLTIQIQSADLEDSPVVDIQYNEMGSLRLNLPTEEKSYSSLVEMLTDLQLGIADYKALEAGAYRSITDWSSNTTYQIAKIEKLENMEDIRLVVGYMTPFVAELWNIDFASLEIIPAQQ